MVQLLRGQVDSLRQQKKLDRLPKQGHTKDVLNTIIVKNRFQRLAPEIQKNGTGKQSITMVESTEILTRVHQSAAKRILFLPHAIRQMSKPDRMITTADIRTVIKDGETIEDYPDDTRGHSCLMLGFADKLPLHVVCAPKDDYLVVITAYLPSDQEWEGDYRKRNKE